jgi:hypothetical protein
MAPAVFDETLEGLQQIMKPKTESQSYTERMTFGLNSGFGNILKFVV